MSKTESTYTAFKQRVRRWAKKEFPELYGRKNETTKTDLSKNILFQGMYIETFFSNAQGYSYSEKENTFKVHL